MNPYSDLLVTMLVQKNQHKLALRVMWLNYQTAKLQRSKEKHNRLLAKVTKQSFDVNADVQVFILRWGIDIHDRKVSK